MQLKIMTFNLRVHVESDGDNAWPNRAEAVAETIRKHDPDIIGVQEGLRGMLADLETLLPEYGWVGEGRDGGTEGEYSAIFYKKDKWEVVESGNFSLSEHPERLGAISWNSSHARMCTWAAFRSGEGGQLALFNTHLDHVSEEAQLKGMELIRERMRNLRARTGLPIVLTGDFNVRPGHDAVAGLEREGYLSVYSVLHDEEREVGGTVHHFKGGESGDTIDYIFLTPDWWVQSVVIDRELYEGRYPSDHYPVVAVVSRG
jgi:endonuclease/exonuclease/phosphatase family metal-dependent hydrolase